MPSALDFITRALRINGTLEENETPTTAMANDGLISINDMLASWSVDRTYVFATRQENFPLVAGTASYTIGPAAVFNTTRPTSISNVFVRLNNVDYPVTELTDRKYFDNIAYKLTPDVPQFYYYDTAFPVGTINLYPVPDQVYTIYVDTWQQLQTFADLATVYTFPPGYNRAINYGLAVEIAPDDGNVISPVAAQIAQESRANIRNLNLPAPIMQTEISMLSNSRYLGYRGY